MAKGYWIAHVDVHDLDGYMEYVRANGPIFEKYGAKFLVRGGKSEKVEGSPPGARHVVLEFKDYETARDCYFSDEYQEVLKLRTPHSQGHFVLVEGHDG